MIGYGLEYKYLGKVNTPSDYVIKQSASRAIRRIETIIMKNWVASRMNATKLSLEVMALQIFYVTSFYTQTHAKSMWFGVQLQTKYLLVISALLTITSHWEESCDKYTSAVNELVLKVLRTKLRVKGLQKIKKTEKITLCRKENLLFVFVFELSGDFKTSLL